MTSEAGGPSGPTRLLLNGLSAVFVAAAAVGVTWAVASTPARPTDVRTQRLGVLPAEPISIARDAAIGSQSARVAVVEFADFQCPFCGVFARDVLPWLKKTYADSGQVLFTYKHLPLSIHPLATPAAEAAECAATRGMFWTLHDAFFRDQRGIDAATIASLSAASGLTPAVTETCLTAAKSKVAEDAALAYELGISGTPTFLVGTIEPSGTVRVQRRLSGQQGRAQFDEALAELGVHAPAVATLPTARQ